MENNNFSGKLIVLEGMDGSGQSTQVKRLESFLKDKGCGVISTKEPTFDSVAGKKIREILDEETKADPAELQKLFAQDRGEHLKNTIIPALRQGKFVISDRYFLSSFAFGCSDGLDLDWLMKINDKFLIPDVTFILKVRPNVCINRIEKRGNKKQLFEKEEKLTRVWETYAILPDKIENAMIIDGEKTIEEVFEEIKKVITLKFL